MALPEVPKTAMAILKNVPDVLEAASETPENVPETPEATPDASHQPPKKKEGCLQAFLGFIALLVFLVPLYIIINGSCHASKKVDGDAPIASYFAEQFVRQRLKSPSTAVFQKFPENHGGVTKSGDKYVVDSYVDSQNGFGANTRTYFTVKLHKLGSKWVLDDIQMY